MESDAGVHCTHVFANASEERSTPDAMGMPFDALYEHANDYDYDYDCEYDYGHTPRNARKIIHTFLVLFYQSPRKHHLIHVA